MMGHRCCSKQKVKRGLWSPEEDEKLIRYITTHGHGSWSSVPKLAGLQRCGKSCRLRWINYLRPELKRGSFSAQEEQIIIDVHRILGNRWAQIAKHLPGRTDNEVKNFWNSCIKKKLISQGLDPKTHNLISSHQRNMMISSSNYKLPVSTTSQQQQPFSLSVLMSTTDVNHHHHHHHQDQHITLLNQNPDLPHPPFVTVPLPSLPPTSGQQHQALPDYQNPNPLWTTITTLPSGSSLIGTPPPVISSSINPFGFGFSDDNSNSTWINPVEHLEAPTPEQMQTHDQHHQVQQMNKNVININISEMENINDHEQKFSGQDDHNIDVSFDSSSFDLELIQSTLLSGAICRDLTAMDDLAWNF